MEKTQCKVKVCGLRHEKNIDQICELKPDYCGLIFYSGSPRAVKGLQLSDVARQRKFVGVFVDESTSSILSKAREYNLSVVQLHGRETRSQVEQLKRKLPEVSVWKAIHISSEFPGELVAQYHDIVDSFLFDTYSEQGGGSGEKFPHALLSRYTGQTPYFLSGGIGPEDCNEVAKLFAEDERMLGVDVNSRFEVSPGLKDVRLLKRFIEELRR